MIGKLTGKIDEIDRHCSSHDEQTQPPQNYEQALMAKSIIITTVTLIINICKIKRYHAWKV